MKQLFHNVFTDGNRLYTKSMHPGFVVHGEKTFSSQGAEYREWNPFKSKLGAAIACGLKEFPFKEGTKVLYLGAAQGVTPSFISDVVGKNGAVYCIEFSKRAVRDLIFACEKRENMIPILADARRPQDYEDVGKVDVLYEDVADREQAQILNENAVFLEKGGFALIAIKARSIDTVAEPRKVFEKVKKELSTVFELVEEIYINKFEEDHDFLVLRKI
ncbi:MAG: fibrillarin-like rRNA/tRNA 2'-O-methyltransferase [Candidatus Micrarchaeota archaeon]